MSISVPNPTCVVRQVRRRKKPTNKGKPAPKRGVRSLLYSTDWVKVRWLWVGVGCVWGVCGVCVCMRLEACVTMLAT